jgi:acyl-CoA synthetase (AMP-forming)/AMP-acid ligase II
MTTYWSLVAQRAAEQPDALLVADDLGNRLTGAAFRDRSEQVARRLAGLGIEPGDRVSWILPSNVGTFVLMAALTRLGAVQNPIVTIYGERDVESITRQIAPKLLVTPGTYRGVDITAMGHAIAPRIGFDVLEISALDSGSERDVVIPTDEDAVRWIFATSGTTAEPKGVQHSDRTIIAAGRALLGNGMRPGTKWGGAVPISHIGGPTLLAEALLVGASLHVVQTFHPVETCNRLREWGTDMVAGVGALVTAMLDYQRGHDAPQFPALRVLNTGGGPKLPRLLERVRAQLGCEMVPSYGMTECPYASVAAFDDPIEARSEGEGTPPPGVEIRIVSESGTLLGPGEEGEIRVRGPQLFLGYVDASLTAEALDDDGFLKSGDLGYVAPEGHLVVTGRIKEMVIRNGETLSVRPIEDLLLQHPSIADATVIGLPHPVTGECICAVVVLREGAELSLQELRSFCQHEGLMRQKWPEQLQVVPLIPRNAMGKAVKPTLVRRFSQVNEAVPSGLASSPM